MMKRNLIILLFIILAGAGGYFYFSENGVKFSKDTSVYRAVPVSSPFFFEISSVKNITSGNQIFSELKEAGIAGSWFDLAQKADSLIEITESIPNGLKNSPFLVAFGYTGRNQLVPLVIAECKTTNREKGFESLIHALYPVGTNSYTKKSYDENTITEISGKEITGSLFYSFSNDFLLVSPQAILVEQVLRQMETTGILKNPYFLDASRISASHGISLFINHTWTTGFFNNILNRTTKEFTDEFGAVRRYQPAVLAGKFNEFAGWSGLGFRFNTGNLILSGISAADDSLHHFLSVFNHQQPLRLRAGDILPRNTSFFCSFLFSDKKGFFEKTEEFYSHSAGYYHREERMKRFDQGMRADVRNVFTEIVKDEIIVAATTIPVNPDNKTVYFIMQTANRQTAEEQLNKLLANYAARSNEELGNPVTEFNAGNDVRFPVYKFPYPSFPGLWIGTPFSMAEARFVSFYDNFMVFANSEQGLQEYLRNMVLGTTLANDVRYQRFRQTSSSRANINIFVDVNKAYSLRNELFSGSLLKETEEKEESIRKFGMVNWQIQQDKGLFTNNLSVAYQEDAGEDAQTTWQSAIGNNIVTKPQLVINHDAPENHEIIFQDSQQNLYQVTTSGIVRWTLALPGPVLGEIHQVDYYKNGKLQYLFNTKDKLYLLDRNGNNVAHFPVSLQSPATNGVNVFDYHNNRDYRYFVAGEDKKIYACDVDGKIVPGWNFDQTESVVTTPVQHFRIDGKDYIVFKDKSNIYIQDRQGETRVTPNARFNNSKNPLMLNLVGAPKIVATDTNGKVYYIYFDGKFDEKKTAQFSENHFFTMDDLDGNGIPDFVFVDGNEVTVMDENGKKLFSQKLDNPLSHPPNIYTFAANLKKIGIVDATSNRIYLYNPDGKLHQGFPLQGNSEFSIGKLSDSSTGLNLVVGSEGGKLYNYTLN